MPSSMGGSICPSFSFWFLWPLYLASGLCRRLSSSAFPSQRLECWRFSCSPVLAIHRNRALSRREIDLKPGTRSSMQTVKGDLLGTRRRKNSDAPSDALLVSFYPTSTLHT